MQSGDLSGPKISLCALLMTCCCPHRRPLHSCQHLLSGVLSRSLSLVLTRSNDLDYIQSTKAHLHSMELNFKQTVQAIFFIFVGRPTAVIQVSTVNSTPCFQGNTCQFCTLFSEQHLSILHLVFRTTPVNSTPCFQNNTYQFCTLFSEQHLSILHPVFRTTPIDSASCFFLVCK